MKADSNYHIECLEKSRLSKDRPSLTNINSVALRRPQPRQAPA